MPTSSIGSDVSRDYATTQAWEDATEIDAASSGIEFGEMYDDSDFTATCNIQGSTHETSVTYRVLRAAAGHEYDPVADTGVFIDSTGLSFGVIEVREDYVRLGQDGPFRIRNLELGSSGCVAYASNANGGFCGPLFFSGPSLPTSNTNCGLLMTGSGGRAQGQEIISCICDGTTSASVGPRTGFFFTVDNAVECNNCVAINIDGNGGTGHGFDFNDDLDVTCRNCIGMNSRTLDFEDTGTGFPAVDIDYCVDSDGSALGANSHGSEIDTDIMVDPDNQDFTLVEGGAAHVGGETLSPVFDDYDEIAHGTENGTWNIGAYDGPTDSGAAVTRTLPTLGAGH